MIFYSEYFFSGRGENLLFLTPLSINESEFKIVFMVNPYPCLFHMEMNQT